MTTTPQQHKDSSIPTGALSGIRVLDLSRILAGPSCTQILGDLGADILKIERPGVGDDIRKWGPPFLKDELGEDTTESGYYLSTGRNKRSICIDFSKPEGREVLLGLLTHCDVLVENYKVGNLKKLGLDYETLKELFPRLIYCSVTGYGQNGPYAARPGYDMVAQAIGGLISIVGEEGRPPAKVPIAIDDIMTGMYACVGILSALRHRDQTGIGQHIDLALLDVQIAWLYNQGVNHFLDGKIPKRMGTGHPNIVPYQIFEAADGYILLGAVNNDQFSKLCHFVGRPELLAREGFRSNMERVGNRAVVNAAVSEFIARQSVDYWVEELANIKLTCSRVNNIGQALKDPQVLSRGMHIKMEHPLSGEKPIDLIGNPLKFSETPVNYRQAPPTLGQHSAEILMEFLGYDQEKIDQLRSSGIL
jgi:crotonobetainyl-CoA:carnitine CoA-transferase CaiB-like acyl-CoA transferase